MARLKTLLVEDEALLRTLLRKGLEETGSYEIVGEAGDGVSGMKMVESTRPDLVLLDIRLPEMDGIEVAERVKRDFSDIKVIILSSRQDQATLRQVLEHGVDGVVDKSAMLNDVVLAIEKVRRGARSDTPAALEVLSAMALGADEGGSLSAREKEVLRRIASGLTNRAIGIELSISELTVKTHRQNIQRKLDIHDTAGLTRYAIDSGLA